MGNTGLSPSNDASRQAARLASGTGATSSVAGRATVDAPPSTGLDRLRAAPTLAERVLDASTPMDALRDPHATTSSASTGADADPPAPGSPEAGAQGATAFAAREGIGAAAARTSYERAVGNLDPTDRAVRTALKESARAATPPVSRAIVEAARPDTGPRSGSTASANRFNAGWNQAGKAFGAVGRAAAAVGVGLGVARISTADDKAAESARVAGGVLGGIAAGSGAGMALGALGANPLTIGAGAIVGAVAGGIAGEAAVDRMIDRARAWWGG